MIPVFKKGWFNGQSVLTISSPMGMRNGKMHNGIDISTNGVTGLNIYSPVAGQVVQRKIQPNGAGLYLVINFYVNGTEYYSLYFMHLKDATVNIGQTVQAGTLIAKSGGAVGDKPNCGRTTGPHLHFEIRKQGTVPVNPIPFLSEKCVLKKTGVVLTEGRSIVDTQQAVEDFVLHAEDVTLISDLNETEQDIVKKTAKTATVKNDLAPGIWQIVKLIMDSSVQNRQMFDSSISFQTGPLINFFNRVCQKPLVEFSGDTWGDQYFFMVRKPPFDKESILKMQELTMINIEDSEIVSQTLSWNNENIYSWYQMIPFSEYGGMTQVNLYMPAVFFPEFASIWGSRDLTVQNQYVNYFMSGNSNTETDNEKKNNGENIIKNAVLDLKYIIEANAYNAFTRKGTIVLNGDRRIKRGTLVMLPSGEQFYVDAVSNSYSVSHNSVSRTTTLSVSHGMFSEFVNEVEVKLLNNKTIKASYFNIIDFGDFDINKVKAENWKETLSKWKVNIDVFSFFCNRGQIKRLQ